MEEVFVVSAARTAIGNFMGTLGETTAPELGKVVIQEVLKRANVEPDQVKEVIMGIILQAGVGQNAARQAAIKAGIPVHVPAFSVNKMCGSGMKSVALAAQSIMMGDYDVAVAGGMEQMTLAPYILPKARTGYRMGHGQIMDTMIYDGIWCTIGDTHMGITAENLAEKYGITREEQDIFAAGSQAKAAKAIAEGKFKEEIVPVMIPQRKGDPLPFETDEFVKGDSTVEKLAKLKPAFKKDGTVTPGNASGVNDGAAALLLMSKKKMEELGLKPLGRLVAYATAAVEPHIMGIGPVPAVRSVLKRAGLTLDDMGLIEANEAFAAQSLSVAKELGLNSDILNVNGGAIALGHPIGASGARIIVTLLHEMKRRGTKYGLATLCIGGGMGIATIWEAIR
jgi:acetyl-CoA C-acetyltransferase